MAARKVMEYRVLEIAGAERFADELNNLVDPGGWRPVQFSVGGQTEKLPARSGFEIYSREVIYIAFLERRQKEPT